jgi:hypothetical protein
MARADFHFCDVCGDVLTDPIELHHLSIDDVLRMCTTPGVKIIELRPE